MAIDKVKSDKIVSRIRPPGQPAGWVLLDFGEMRQYRDLLYFLTWRDIQVKYKQTLLGIAWAVLVPVTTMVIFGLIFGRVAKLPSDGLNPYLFYLTGLVPWQYFATSLSMAANSLVGAPNLLTKIYMPRLFLPLSACLAALVDLLVSFAVLVVMMVWMKILPAATIIFTPVLILIAVLSALGVGSVFAALNVKYRDIRYVLPFIIQIWMFCSVIIPFSKIPETWGAWRYLYGLNPMAGVIEGFRWCLMHNNMLSDITGAAVELPWALICISALVSAALLMFGLCYFKRTERYFADII